MGPALIPAWTVTRGTREPCSRRPVPGTLDLCTQLVCWLLWPNSISNLPANCLLRLGSGFVFIPSCPSRLWLPSYFHLYLLLLLVAASPKCFGATQEILTLIGVKGRHSLP